MSGNHEPICHVEKAVTEIIMNKIKLLLMLILLLLPFAGAAFAEELVYPGYAMPNWPNESVPQKGLEELDPGAPMKTSGPFQGNVKGKQVPVYPQNTQHAGVLVPDGRGGYVWTGAHKPIEMPPTGEAAGRELKLKVRELADQLLSIESTTSLAGAIALPTTFVHQDDFQSSSSFGRYIAEQLFYEFNQRGMPVREYRVGAELVSRPRQGDFFLSRNAGNIVMNSRRAAVVVGTYYHDRYNVYVNARLINGVTGMVLRTANVVFPQNQVTRGMFANVNLKPGYMRIMDYDTVTNATDLTAIDLGEDVH